MVRWMKFQRKMRGERFSTDNTAAFERRGGVKMRLLFKMSRSKQMMLLVYYTEIIHYTEIR
jgi:hypothetical protein